MSDLEREFADTVERLALFEKPQIDVLKVICGNMGYGRVIQLAEQWMEELSPGWLAARDECAYERVRDDRANQK